MSSNNLINILPNLFSVFIVFPFFLYVGMFPTKIMIFYIILFIIAITLTSSILYSIVVENKELTIGRILYLIVFIPLLLFISYKKDKSHIYSRYLLIFIAVLYLLVNFNVAFIENENDSIISVIFNGFPIHPLKRFI